VIHQQRSLALRFKSRIIERDGARKRERVRLTGSAEGIEIEVVEPLLPSLSSGLFRLPEVTAELIELRLAPAERGLAAGFPLSAA
jgi:hypothetical protein